MALQEDVPRMFREVIESIMMTMASGNFLIKEIKTSHIDDWEFTDPLVDFGFAIAFRADDFVRMSV